MWVMLSFMTYNTAVPTAACVCIPLATSLLKQYVNLLENPMTPSSGSCLFLTKHLDMCVLTVMPAHHVCTYDHANHGLWHIVSHLA